MSDIKTASFKGKATDAMLPGEESEINYLKDIDTYCLVARSLHERLKSPRDDNSVHLLWPIGLINVNQGEKIRILHTSCFRLV